MVMEPDLGLTVECSKEEPPKLLALILGRENVKSLKQVLLEVEEVYPREAKGLKHKLVSVFDHNDYRKLLEQTWCRIRKGQSGLSEGFSLQQYSTQVDVRVEYYHLISRYVFSCHLMCDWNIYTW